MGAMTAREHEAWDRWEKQYHSKAVATIIQQHQQARYFKYNDHMVRIEPIYQREHILRNVRSRKSKRRAEEIYRLKTHPLHNASKERKRAFEKNDMLTSSGYAEAASIGEYIKLSLMPAVIYVKILKHVQIQAIRILGRQLFMHCRKQDTRIHLKQSQRTGKYTYNVWLSTKQIKSLTEDEFYKKLMGVTKNGKRSVTLMVKQNIRKGSIHMLWQNEHSLV